MEGIGALHSLLPDLQSSICDAFTSAECSVEASPDLKEPPFRFEFPSLGRKLYLLPPGTSPPKDFLLLTSLPEGEVVTDGLVGETIHMVLEGGSDWCSPVQGLFNKNLGSDWAFVVMELNEGVPKFHLLKPDTKPEGAFRQSIVLWMSPLILETPLKAKVVKKVLVKKSPEKLAAEKNGTAKPTKTATGAKIVRKKVVNKDGLVVTNGDAKEKPSESVNGVKKIVGEKSPKLRETSSKGEVMNGEGSGIDSGVSVADSDNERSQKLESTTPEMNGNGKAAVPKTSSSAESPMSSSLLSAQEAKLAKTSESEGSSSECATKEKVGDSEMSTSFTMTLGGVDARLESRRMERIVEEEEKQKADEPLFNGTVDKLDRQADDNDASEERCSPELSSISSRLSPPSDSSEKCGVRVESRGHKQRHASPASVHVRQVVVRNRVELPVLVLQQVLKKFNFKELGELRQVHPHWDELCGQSLNTGYYELVKKADHLLTECQRRVQTEKGLHDALSVLTNVQVHVLNPVDILRPAMDEGVCCFPYGDLLDKTYAIIANVERMMKGETDLIVNWKSTAELARKAQIHYKTSMEALMEEKLGDVFRLKALQRIQRIDSFMIDSTVTKLEKAAHMAREDIEWEIEQLRQQNAQLKKDNRELKKDYMRLEARVEVLENKFRTMARLLQSN